MANSLNDSIFYQNVSPYVSEIRLRTLESKYEEMLTAREVFKPTQVFMSDKMPTKRKKPMAKEEKYVPVSVKFADDAAPYAVGQVISMVSNRNGSIEPFRIAAVQANTGVDSNDNPEGGIWYAGYVTNRYDTDMRVYLAKNGTAVTLWEKVPETPKNEHARALSLPDWTDTAESDDV